MPQALTYLLSSPSPQAMLYGMVTNGREALFLKCDRHATPPHYSYSPTYRLLENAPECAQVLQGLKFLGAVIQPTIGKSASITKA